MARVRWGAMQHSSLWLLFGFVALLSNLRTLRMAEIAVVTSSSLLSTTAFDDSPETWEHQNATIHTLSFFPSTAGVVQLDQHPLGVKNSNENNPFPKEEEENEDEGRNDNKPLLLLHIGPHKTATSSIQCQFSHHRRLLSETASFVYIGRLYGVCLGGDTGGGFFDPRDIVRCLGSNHEPCDGRNSTIWKRVDEALWDLAKDGKNVVVSDEAFSRIRTGVAGSKVSREREDEVVPYRLLHGLLTRHYRVRVVVGYRRYHEWVTSSYNHYIGSKIKKGDFPSNYLYRHCLERGFSRDYSYFKKAHPTEHLLGMYGSVFDDVVVFDMHDNHSGEDLMEKFLNQTGLLPRFGGGGEVGLGTVLKSMRNYKPENPNTGMPWASINILTMAMAAQRWGLVGSGLKEGGTEEKNVGNDKRRKKDKDKREVNRKRIQIAKAIQRTITETGERPPLDCLSAEEAEVFLNKSLVFERRLFDADHLIPTISNRHYTYSDMRDREAEHRAKFSSAMHCSIDIDRVRNDTKWLNFFGTL